MAHMKVVEFQGNPKANVPASPPRSLPAVANRDLTPSPDVPLAILKRRLMAANSIAASRALLLEIDQHLKVGSGEYSLAETAAPAFWVSARVCHSQIRRQLADVMYRVVRRVTGDASKAEKVLNERAGLTQHGCYQAAVNHYKRRCFNWHQQEVNLR